jgi:hypothetical protein
MLKARRLELNRLGCMDLLQYSQVPSYEGVGVDRMALGSEKEEAAIVALGARTSSRDVDLCSRTGGHP